jgi:outer membrane receptor protein involved in Fe transport
MRLNILVLSLLALTVTVPETKAQSAQSSQSKASISGHITDQRGDGISGADVTATSASGSVSGQTDGTGQFKLDLASGDYEVRVKAKGFATRIQKIALTSAQDQTVTWSLDLSAIPEVMTVTPTRVERSVDEVSSSVSVLNSTDVENAAAQTLDDLLRQVPGFSIFRRSSSVVANPTTQGVSLRGAGASGASRTLVLTDGLPLNDAFGGWVYWDRVPRAAVDQIEVVRGGSSDLYGSDALSGVINVLTQRPTSPVFNAEASYGNNDTADFTFFGGGEWKKWVVDVTGEATTTDGYYVVAPERRGTVDERAASDHNVITARVGRTWGSTPAGHTQNIVYIRGSAFDEDRKNGTPLQRNNTNTESLAAGLRFRTSDGSAWQFTAYGNQQRYHQTFTSITADRSRESLTREQAVPAKDAGFSFTWSRPIGGRNLLLAGADDRGVRGSSDELAYAGANPSTYVSAGGRQQRLGFFAQDLISITSRWQLSLSARYDRWRDSSAYSIERTIATGVVRPRFLPERTEDALSPKISLLYHINEALSLSASAYRAFRAPTLNELYRSFRVGDTLTLGNEKLEAERLTGGEGGIGWQNAGRVRMRLVGYWTETVNPITNYTLSVTPALITRERRNLGRTRSRGIEAETEFHIDSSWNISAGYLYSDASVLEAPQDPRLVGLWIPQVPRHQFTLQTTWSNPRYLRASLQFRASGKQYDDDQNKFVLDSYALVDLLVDRSLGKGLDLFFAMQNALNQRYAVGKTPLETIGAPRLYRGGIRIRLGK